MRIPTQAKGVGPHVGRAAMDQDEQRIRTRRVESGRYGIEAVNALAATRGEPELAQRLPVDPRHALAIEMGGRRPPSGRGIDAHDFGGTACRLPHPPARPRASWSPRPLKGPDAAALQS